MNHARALSMLGACSVIVFSVVVYLKYAAEDSMIRPVDDPAPSAHTAAVASKAPIAAQSELESLPATVDNSLKKDMADEKIAELSIKLKHLDEKFDALNQEVQRRLAAPPPAASKEERSEEAELGDPRTDPRALAEFERQEQERAQTLENNFWNESTRDSQWSSQASTALENALASAQAGNTQVNSLECRSRQCRVELVFQDDVSRNNLMSTLPRQLAEILPTIAIHHAERRAGTTTMVLYLFGEGYELPEKSG